MDYTMFNILCEIDVKDRSHSSICDCLGGEGENSKSLISFNAYDPDE